MAQPSNQLTITGLQAQEANEQYERIRQYTSGSRCNSAIITEQEGTVLEPGSKSVTGGLTTSRATNSHCSQLCLNNFSKLKHKASLF